MEHAKARRALLLLSLVGAGALVLALPRGLVQTTLLNVVNAVAGALAVRGALNRAEREREARRGWRLVGLGMAMYVLYQAWTLGEIVVRRAPPSFPGIAEIFGMLMFPILGVGLSSLPTMQRSRAERWRTGVDALTFALAVMFLLGAGGVADLTSNASIALPIRLLAAFPFAAVAVLFGLIVYAAEPNVARYRGPLGYLLVAIALAGVNNLLALRLTSYYVGHPVDLLTLASIVMFLAAVTSPRPLNPESGGGSRALGWLVHVPPSAVLVVAIVAVGRMPAVPKSLLWLGAAVIVGLLARELMALRDVQRFSRDLEARVAERTRALEKTQEALGRARRLEALGRLAGGVAHDFNNIIMVANWNATVLREGAAPGSEELEAADEIAAVMERASSLTGQLLAFARRQPTEPRTVDPGALMRDLQKMLHRLVGDDVELEVSVGRPVPVRIDPAQLEQVVINLVVNARDAMPRGGRLEIVVGAVVIDAAHVARHPGSSEGRHSFILVADSGEGMDPETLSRVFEPFFTTKPPGRGTGLGLATCYGIVTEAGGHITFDSRVGQGTLATVYLPEDRQPMEVPKDSAVVPEIMRGTGTVLLTEDTQALLSLMAEALERAGYTVLKARDGQEAVDTAERHPEIDLLVTDMVMPKLNGPEVIAKVRAKIPDVAVLAMSGYSEQWALAPRGSFDFELLSKPFGMRDFVERVYRVLQKRREALGRRD